MRKKIGLMIYKRYVFVESHHIAPLPDERHSVFEKFINDRVINYFLHAKSFLD